MKPYKLSAKMPLVVGVGSALIDILVHEEDEVVRQTGAAKGGMTYVDAEFSEQLLAMSSRKPKIVPGGSACNTIVGIGKLGGQARFVGKCGSDDMGRFFANNLQRQNVEPLLFRCDSPTGRVLSVITPDAQRSMFTYLGASAKILPEEITPQCFSDAAIVHIEGYLLFNPELILAVLEAAKAAGAAVSLDLASFTVVMESKTLLATIIDEYVNILIANQDEARVFTGYADETEAIQALAAAVDIAVLNVGERGSLIAHQNEIIAVEPQRGAAIVDTTGAGDLWTAGFLFGLVSGFPARKAGELGTLCGYEVCRVVGTKIPSAGWKRIKGSLTRDSARNPC